MHMAKEAHNVEMGQQHAANQLLLSKCEQEAQRSLAKMQDKLDVTQGPAQQMRDSVISEANIEIQNRVLSVEAENKVKELKRCEDAMMQLNKKELNSQV